MVILKKKKKEEEEKILYEYIMDLVKSWWFLHLTELCECGSSVRKFMISQIFFFSSKKISFFFNIYIILGNWIKNLPFWYMSSFTRGRSQIGKFGAQNTCHIPAKNKKLANPQNHWHRRRWWSRLYSQHSALLYSKFYCNGGNHLVN